MMRNAVDARKSVLCTVFVLLRGCGKLEFLTNVIWFLAYFVEPSARSGFRIVLTVQSSQFVDSDKLP